MTAKPSTFADIWTDQERNLVALGIGAPLRSEMRRAFYAGACSLVGALQGAKSDGPAIQALINEVVEWGSAHLHAVSAAGPQPASPTQEHP